MTDHAVYALRWAALAGAIASASRAARPIYYEAYPAPSGVSQIWRCDEDGANEVQLFDDANSRHRPAVSPDGTELAYILWEGATSWVCVAQSDGGGERRLASSTTVYGFRSVNWHPDGSQLVFVEGTYNGSIGEATSRDGYLWSCNSDGGEKTLLLPGDIDFDKHYAAYSPGGSTICIGRNETGWYAWPQNLFLCDADGSNLRKITFHPNGEANKVFTCRFSPDGTRLVYQRGWGSYGSSIWIVNADGSGDTLLVDTADAEEEPTFTWDGTHILYQSYLDGRWQLMSVHPDGSGAAPLAQSATLHRRSPAQQQPAAAPGRIRCVIEPPRAAAEGAQWRLVETQDMDWHESGETSDWLNPADGPFMVDFLYLSGWDPPENFYGLLPGPGQTLTITGVYRSADMILVPGGTFQMGSADGAVGHEVTLGDFQIDSREVTVGEYQLFCQDTGTPMPAPPSWGWTDTNLPMVNVTWNEAAAYAAWSGKRLPTEAEYEKAMRTGAPDGLYPWGDAISPQDANFGNHIGRPTMAGTYPPTMEPDLYDIAGNVWEWCYDWHQNVLAGPVTNPVGPAAGTHKVMRGGSWVSTEQRLRCTPRFFLGANEGYADVGFRCAANVEPPYGNYPHQQLGASGGLPKWWVMRYFGTEFGGPAGGFDPGADHDGDTLPTGAEFFTGTSPTDGQSVLAVTGVEPAGAGGRVAIRWSSQAGKRYRIEQADDLNQGFSILADGLGASPPTNIFLYDSRSAGPGFYRVRTVE